MVATCRLAPPAPPVKATPVCFPSGFFTGEGPVEPGGTGNVVPFDETTKFGEEAGAGAATEADVDAAAVGAGTARDCCAESIAPDINEAAAGPTKGVARIIA